MTHIHTNAAASEKTNDVSLAVSGDQQAFSRLITAEENRLYRIAKSILKSDADCADAMQEAIIRAWRRLHTLKEPSHFNHWLIRILLRECYRLALRRQKLPFLQVQDRPDKQTDWDLRWTLHQAMDGLRAKERIVLELYYTQGYKVKEIADILRVPKGTVLSRMHRGRAHLREALKEVEI